MALTFLLELNQKVFDVIEQEWEKEKTQSFLGTIMVLAFIFSLLFIQLNRWSILPNWFEAYFGRNHFFAIEIVFVLLLTFEIISLILNLTKSVAISMAKQFEIFSLILLRDAFKALGHLSEPIIWDKFMPTYIEIITDTVSGILIFGGILLFKDIAKHRPINEDPKLINRFILSKKVVSNFLLLIFIFLAGLNLFDRMVLNEKNIFFNNFYTILIFSDILIVIISLRYSYNFLILFRNSGFAVATVLIRLALSAPGYYSPIMGITAMTIVILISYIYNKFPIHDENEI